MIPEADHRGLERPNDDELAGLLAACLADDAAACERFAAGLTAYARLTVDSFLNPEHPDGLDLAQDTVIAVMAYLRRAGRFDGSLVNFTVAAARNRCRNWLAWQKHRRAAPLEDFSAWLVSPERNPLELLEDADVRRLVRQGIARLDGVCRDLLRGLYLEELTVEEMRRRAGLKSVQAVYYRRAQCLKKIAALLKDHLFACSSADAGPATVAGDADGNIADKNESPNTGNKRVFPREKRS